MSPWDPLAHEPTHRGADDALVHRRAPGKRARTQSILARTHHAGAAASTSTTALGAAGAQPDPYDFSYVTPSTIPDDVWARVQHAIDEATTIAESAVEIPVDLANVGWQLILWSDEALQGHAGMDNGYVMYGTHRGGGSESDDAGMGPSKNCHPVFDWKPPELFGGFSTSKEKGYKQVIEIFKFNKTWITKFAEHMGWMKEHEEGFAPETFDTPPSGETLDTHDQTEPTTTTTTTVIPAAAEDGSGNLATTNKKDSQWAVNSDKTIHNGPSRAGSVEAETTTTTDRKEYTPREGFAAWDYTNAYGHSDDWLGAEGGVRLVRYQDGSVDVLWYVDASFVKVLATLQAGDPKIKYL